MIYYLTVDDVKTNTELQQHIDPYLIEPSIRFAQETYIEPLLGRELAKALTIQVNLPPVEPTDPPTLPNPQFTLNALLLEQIKLPLAWWSLYEAIPTIAIKLTSQGVEIKSGKNGQPASRGDIEYMRENIRSRAEAYTARLKEYLLENKADYPLYPTSNLGCNSHTTTRVVGGIAIPPYGPYSAVNHLDGLDHWRLQREYNLYRKLIR